MVDAGSFEVESYGERFNLEIHIDNPAREPRIRWETVGENLSGDWGRLYLPEGMAGGIDQVLQEPILRFEVGETIIIGGKKRTSIKLPHSLAVRLQKIIDKIETVSVDSTLVETNPNRFPSTIAYETKIATENLHKACWDPNQYVMWYAPDRPTPPKQSDRLTELISSVDLFGYQISQGELIHRANELPPKKAVRELKHFLDRTMPNTSPDDRSSSYRIEYTLE